MLSLHLFTLSLNSLSFYSWRLVTKRSCMDLFIEAWLSFDAILVENLALYVATKRSAFSCALPKEELCIMIRDSLRYCYFWLLLFAFLIFAFMSINCFSISSGLSIVFLSTGPFRMGNFKLLLLIEDSRDLDDLALPGESFTSALRRS